MVCVFVLLLICWHVLIFFCLLLNYIRYNLLICSFISYTFVFFISLKTILAVHQNYNVLFLRVFCFRSYCYIVSSSFQLLSFVLLESFFLRQSIGKKGKNIKVQKKSSTRKSSSGFVRRKNAIVFARCTFYFQTINGYFTLLAQSGQLQVQISSKA